MSAYHSTNSHLGVDQFRLSTAFVVQDPCFESIGPRNNIPGQSGPSRWFMHARFPEFQLRITTMVKNNIAIVTIISGGVKARWNMELMAVWFWSLSDASFISPLCDMSSRCW